jgi:uncharacterized protein with PIN domain
MNVVLDASAIIAFLRGEPGALLKRSVARAWRDQVMWSSAISGPSPAISM